MSLVADYSSSSESDDFADSTVPQREPNEKKPKLPSANLLLGGATTVKTGEVFSNPYKQAEQAKIALLERHVKMVDEHLKEKNGKKICWNYRKGRCRFGSNCSFAHDSDLSNELVNESSCDTIKSNVATGATISKVHQGLQLGNQSTNDSLNSLSESAATISSKKRQRPGLSESIVPSKRVLKAYSQQKQPKNQNQNKLT